MVDNTFKAVMPGGAPLWPQAHLSHWQIKLIVDYEHVFWRQFVPANQLSYRFSTVIHIRDRFDQHHFFSTNGAIGNHGPSAPLPPPAGLCRQLVYDAKTNIMPCLVIMKAWITQSNYQFQNNVLATISQARC